MTLAELLAEYKGEVNVNVQKITDEGLEDAITFKNTEAGAIVESLLKSTVSNFTFDVSETVPAKTVLVVTVVETKETP